MEVFNAKTKVFQYRQVYNSVPEIVFPLLCYNKEYEWIPTWKCKQVYSKTGYMEKGCIFVSYLPNLDFSSALGEVIEMYWYVTTHDTGKYIIESVNYVHDSFILKFSINLEDNKDGKTAAIFRHEYTGISQKGNEFVENGITEEIYKSQQQFLEKCMNHFLDTGKMIKLQ